MRTFLKLFGLTVSLFLFIAVPAVAMAQTPSATATPKPTARDSMTAEFKSLRLPTFAAQNQVTLDQGYAGSVFAAGGQVTFTGATAGDLVVTGGTVIVDGEVEQDVYAAGGTVIIRGAVGGNVIAAGGEVQINETAEIRDSVILAGEQLSVNGVAGGGAWLTGSRILIGGAIYGDVHVESESLEITPNAHIVQSVSGQVETPVELNGNATAAANMQIVQGERSKKALGAAGLAAALTVNWAWVAVLAIGHILLIALLIKLVPKLLQRGSEVTAKSPVEAFLVGTTFAVFMPVILILLTITIVGLPVALFGFGLYMAVLWLGWVFPAMWLGRLILPKQTQLVQGVVAVAVLSLVGAIPVIGWVISLLIGILGAGTLLLWWGKERV